MVLLPLEQTTATGYWGLTQTYLTLGVTTGTHNQLGHVYHPHTNRVGQTKVFNKKPHGAIALKNKKKLPNETNILRVNNPYDEDR